MNEKKPINVLAEYMTDWIHHNNDEVAPFDSFESIAEKRTEQKDIERWIFNCNYLYYRFGNYLFDDINLCPTYLRYSEADHVLAFSGENLKTIKDSNPLNLRSKQDQAVISEFLKDWPPLVKSSRNQVTKLEKALDRFYAEFTDEFGDNTNKIEQITNNFLAEMRTEAQFYAGFSHSDAKAHISMIKRCKDLLALWSIKEINPLYTPLIWEDEDAISQLSELLKDSFVHYGYPSAQGDYHHESYIYSVRQTQIAYTDSLMNFEDDELTDLKALTIPEISKRLDADGFSLSRASEPSSLSLCFFKKARLIWNVIGCAIFGPKEIINKVESEQTYTHPRYTLYDKAIDEQHDGLQGEIILRRLYRERGPEMAGRLMVEDVQQNRLWKVIGAYYDDNAALPPSEFRAEYENLRGLFIATQGYDESGDVTEGNGDSRHHAELSVRVDEAGRRWLVLVDLGSKNGTYVVRNRGEQLRYYILRSGGHLDIDDWDAEHDIDPSSVEIVDELILLRGDIIHLCGSCFEVL